MANTVSAREWKDLASQLEQIEHHIRSSGAATEFSHGVTLGDGPRAENFWIRYRPGTQSPAWSAPLARFRNGASAGHGQVRVSRTSPDFCVSAGWRPGFVHRLLQRFHDWRNGDKARWLGTAFLESRESAIQRRLSALLFKLPEAGRKAESPERCCERVFAA